MQNKKMMLCESVGGHEYDLTRMYSVKYGDKVQCPHSNLITRPDVPNLDTELVSLEPLVFKGELIGIVGKCSCGKIYYREENKYD